MYVSEDIFFPPTGLLNITLETTKFSWPAQHVGRLVRAQYERSEVYQRGLYSPLPVIQTQV